MNDHTRALELAEFGRLPEKAQKIVRHFKMNKIPHEGPWFLETYRSKDVIEGALAERYSGVRIAYTGIYALATRESFSALHRLRTDEMWHFYGGDPIEILLLKVDGSGEMIVMGTEVLEGQRQQFLIPAETWMAARPIANGAHGYSFIANTLSPGFEYTDYDAGYRNELSEQYPQFKDEIEAFTREDSIERPSDRSDVTPKIQIEELVGRTSAFFEEDLSIAKLVMDASAHTPSSSLSSGMEYVFVVNGRGTVRIGEQLATLQRNAIVAFPPGTPHSIHAETALEALVICAPAFHPERHIVEKRDVRLGASST